MGYQQLRKYFFHFNPIIRCSRDHRNVNKKGAVLTQPEAVYTIAWRYTGSGKKIVETAAKTSSEALASQSAKISSHPLASSSLSSANTSNSLPAASVDNSENQSPLTSAENSFDNSASNFSSKALTFDSTTGKVKANNPPYVY